VLIDGTKSIDCEFAENGALPACGYETGSNSKLNWTLRYDGETIIIVRQPHTEQSFLSLPFLTQFNFVCSKNNKTKDKNMQNIIISLTSRQHFITRYGFPASLFVCLFVCLQHNSKTNDLKVFKLGVGIDRPWDILEVTWIWG